MEITLKISADDVFISAINALTDAIRNHGTASNVVSLGSSEPAQTSEKAPEADTGPIYWANNSSGQFGKVNSEADYQKLKKKDEATYKIPKEVYEQKAAELRQKNADQKAEAEAKKKSEAESKKSGKTENETAKTTAPSVEDIIAVFSQYLPKDLDANERKERAGFVKPMLERFGAAKASEIPEEYRALAVNLVQRKLAGEDVDPKTAELADLKASEEAGDDLV